MESDKCFKRGQDHDGVSLWFSLIKFVHPTTKVSSSNHKDDLGEVHLKTFGCDIKKFNLWFEGKRRDIIRDEGSDACKERVRHLFKACMTAENKEFLETMRNMRGSG